MEEPQTRGDVAAEPLPLVVDLDGTLIRSDIFADSIVRFLSRSPLNLFVLLGWLTRGRAYAKFRLAKRAPVDPASLPYDERVIEFVAAERARGRQIFLATASDRNAAEAVAQYVGLFRGVFASDGRENLKSARKAARLRAAFPRGFAYAGNERADIKVWAVCASVVLVNAGHGLARLVQLRFGVDHVIEPTENAWRALLEAMRVRTWAKNALVLAPLLAGSGLADADAWANALLAFSALSLVGSSICLVDEAARSDADRLDPCRRLRPFARGAVSPLWGLTAAGMLLAMGLTFGSAAGAGGFVAIYTATTAFYSWLRQGTLLGALVLAALCTLPIVIGGAATGYVAPDWLVAASFLSFFALASIRRHNHLPLPPAPPWR